MSWMSLPVLFESVARATVILAATGLVAAALRRSSASARHLVWALGLTSALLVPALALAVPKWELPIVRIPAAVIVSADPNLPAEPAGLEVGGIRPSGQADRAGAPAVLSAAPAISRAAQDKTSHAPAFAEFIRSISPSTIVFAAWLLGAAVVLGRMLLGLAAVQWMSRRTRVVTDGPWLPLARELAADMAIARVRFVQSDTASMPMAWGVFRASVLMPADADTWPLHRLRVVLLHELAHVKRRDCVTHLLAQIACAAYWFNPLAWIAVRRLRSERERACDDLVLQAGTRGSDYADELLDIARVMQAQRFPAMLGGASLAMAHRSQLEGRLMAILDPTVPRRGLTRARTAAAAATFVVLIGSVASVQPWAEAAVAGPYVGPVETPQAATSVTATARAAADVRVKTDTAVAERVVERDSVQAHAVASDDARHGRADIEGVVGGVVDGVVNSVVGGVVDGVVEGVAAAVQAMPNPNPNPNPRPAIAGGDDQKRAVDPRAVAALMDALKDTDKEVRETAMHALVQMRDPRMFDPLVAALKDASADVREQAAFGLGQLRDKRAVDPLVASLHDANGDVREQVVFALGQLRDPRAVDGLISALKDEAADVREQAAFALGQLRDAKSIEALVIALKDSKPDVREQAAFALGQLRDPRAIEGLTLALKDSNVDVRRQAAFALGQIRY